MKKIVIAGVLLLALCAGIYAQTETEKAGDIDFPQLMFHNYTGGGRPVWLTGDGPEGRLLTTREATDILRQVPENTALIKRAQAWRAISWVFAGVMTASLLCDLVYAVGTDLPNRDIVLMSSLGFGAAAAVNWDVFNGMYESSLNHAMENYNLRIMGIPIPTGK